MQRRVLKGESGPVCLASLADQLTSRNSARRWASISPILTSPSCGYFLRLLSAWIVAPRNLLFRKKSCANSQRETRRQVNLEIESYFSLRITAECSAQMLWKAWSSSSL